MVSNTSASYYGPCLIKYITCTTLNFEFDECVFSQSVTHMVWNPLYISTTPTLHSHLLPQYGSMPHESRCAALFSVAYMRETYVLCCFYSAVLPIWYDAVYVLHLCCQACCRNKRFKRKFSSKWKIRILKKMKIL